MRRRLPLSLSALPLLAVLLTLLCGVRVRGVQRAPPPYSRNSSSPFSSLTAACNATFFDFNTSEDEMDDFGRVLGFQAVAALCPADCLVQQRSGDNSSVAVLGSFPYHPSSSVCLAAVHAGIIDGGVGGGVFVSRFYRQDWSGGSSQTVFPFNSSRGTLSNGVRSLDVPSSLYSTPSNSTSFSFTVRGRGDFASQRRPAPWGVRAGHLALMFSNSSELVDFVIGVYHPEQVGRGYFHLLIAGGYNGSAYLNDCWVGTLHTAPSVDWEWQRLPDAPWSPRADVSIRSQRDALMMIVGGQTAHSCGLYELGVCSGEAWGLNVSTSDVDGSFAVQWSARPLFELPFHPRCGSALLNGGIRAWNVSPEVVDDLLIVGGQLSYNDSYCASHPTTVNEVWGVAIDRHRGHLVGDWALQSPAPFSPRRFSASDSCADSASFFFSPGCLLSGGVRHAALAWDAVGRPRLSVSEVFADVWSRQCSFLKLFSSRPLCDFVPSNRTASEVSGYSVFPVAALPVPLSDADSPLSLAVVGNPVRWLSTAVGGRTSASALQRWRDTRPPIAVYGADLHELRINLTMTDHPAFGTRGQNDSREAAVQFELLLQGRMQLPLSARVDEEELNDPAGAFQLGSEWVSASIADQGDGVAVTFHRQPRAFADSPDDSSWFVPQAASSANTSRPQLNFALRRHSHRQTRLYQVRFIPVSLLPFDLRVAFMGVELITGGRSGQTFFNDVVVHPAPRCLPPVDPAYWGALGPAMRSVPLSEANLQERLKGGSVMAELANLEQPSLDTWPVYCDDGYHFEPPQLEAEVGLTCLANGMWMQREAQSIVRCERNHLNCTLPLQDTGGLYCQPALPQILRLSGSFPSDGGSTALTSRDAVTLLDVPLTSGVSLTIHGNAFFQPVRVRVGNYGCQRTTLSVEGTGSEGSQAYNWTDSQGGEPRLVLGVWGSMIVCELPAVFGSVMVVDVSSGILGDETVVDVHSLNRNATLSSTPPVLTRLIADPDDCSSDEQLPLALFDCVNSRPFTVRVCASFNSVGSGDVVQQEVVAKVGDVQEALNCSADWDVESQLQGDQVCTDCVLAPHLSTVRIFARHHGQSSMSQQAATVSFQPCAPGTRNVYEPQLLRPSSSVCLPCPPGSSTANVSSAPSCTPCAAGYFANLSGQAVCEPCPVGTFAASINSTDCTPCQANSVAPSEGRTACEACVLNQYLVPVANGSVGVDGRCTSCPEQLLCLSNGTVLPAAGTYALLDRARGLLSATQCSWQACVDFSRCISLPSPPLPGPPFLSSTPSASRSSLSVLNCCSGGRFAAFVADASEYVGVESLEASGGYNVLCAACLPGWTSVSGRCIPCASTNGFALSAFLLLSFLLVYAVHRLPHDWSGRASWTISVNFLQLSVLLLASESMPQLFSLINVSLLGDQPTPFAAQQGPEAEEELHRDVAYSGFCIAPLTDGERIAVQLASPLVAFALLACVAALQLTWATIAAASHSSSSSSSSSSRLSSRLYRWLCIVRLPACSEAALVDESHVVSVRPLAGRASRDGQAEQLNEALLPSTAEPSAWWSSASDERPVTEVDEQPGRGVTMPQWLAYQNSAVRLVQLSYIGLCSLTLHCFQWQDVGDFGQRLAAFPTLSPSSPAYRQLRPLVICTLTLLVLALPLTLALYLVVQHRRGNIAAVKQRQRRGETVDGELRPPPSARCSASSST